MGAMCNHPDPALCAALGFHLHGRLYDIWRGRAEGLDAATCRAYRQRWLRGHAEPARAEARESPFDRVVLINLARRCDRLDKCFTALARAHWPFQWPEVFSAIDGYALPTPPGFQSGAGAWGCLQSHRQVIERAILDKVNHLLVLEDDLILAPDFRSRVLAWLKRVPDDFDGLMLGGQHHKPAEAVTTGVLRAINAQRTHAYSARGEYLLELYRAWHAPMVRVHCDWIMGSLHSRFRIYAPDPWLCGQSRSHSDITCRENPTKFWQPPTGREPIIVLRATAQVMQELRSHGWHSGFQREPQTDFDVGLVAVTERRGSLADWINELQWEVVSEQNWVLTVWHPKITVAEVRAAWGGPVYEIAASTAAEALMQWKCLRPGADNAA